MRDDPVDDAAKAHTTLVLMATIRDLVESSDCRASERTRSAIYAACRREMDRQLRLYDNARARVK